MSFDFSQFNNQELDIDIHPINVEIYSFANISTLLYLDDFKKYIADDIFSINVEKDKIDNLIVKLVFVSPTKLDIFFNKIINAINQFTIANNKDVYEYMFATHIFLFAKTIHIDFLNHTFEDIKLDNIGYFHNYTCTLYIDNLKANELYFTYNISSLPKFKNCILNYFKYKQQYHTKKEWITTLKDDSTYIQHIIEVNADNEL